MNEGKGANEDAKWSCLSFAQYMGQENGVYCLGRGVEQISTSQAPLNDVFTSGSLGYDGTDAEI